jgi:hypothetical protein
MQMLGGCCGTSPAFIAAVGKKLGRHEAARACLGGRKGEGDGGRGGDGVEVELGDVGDGDAEGFEEDGFFELEVHDREGERGLEAAGGGFEDAAEALAVEKDGGGIGLLFEDEFGSDREGDVLAGEVEVVGATHGMLGERGEV